MDDLALAVTAVFLGLEQLLSLEDDATRSDHQVFQSISFLASVLAAMLQTLPSPPTDPAG